MATENTQQISNIQELLPVEDAIARLQPHDAEYRLAILNFMTNKVPIIETQKSLGLILASNSILEKEYSSFLMYPVETDIEREAARQKLGAILKIPLLYTFPPNHPTMEETEEFFIFIKERCSKEIYCRFCHIWSNLRLPNSQAGIRTRPTLVKLLRDDVELLQMFEKHWPKEDGDI